MKRFILMSAFSAMALGAIAQSNVSKPMSFRIEKEIKPAVLEIVPGSVKFVEPSGNNAIDANETAKISFQVTNNGTGDGVGCIAKISAVGSTQGLTYQKETLPIIKIGATQTVELPITANMNTVDGNVDFTVQVDEPNGFGTDPVELKIDTRKFVSPYLQVVDYTVIGNGGSSVLEKKKPFDLQILLQNTQYGRAEDVKVSVEFPQGILWYKDSNDTASVKTIEGGKTKSLVYSVLIPTNYSQEVIPVKVKISEKYGKYSENKTINLKLNQTLATNKIEIDAKDEALAAITIASLGSDVDKDIPETGIKNEKTYAVIIANEDYTEVAKVPYARNDGEVFKKYCQNTLGLTEKHIHFIPNATKNQIGAQIEWLNQVIDAREGDVNIILYYAGHGIPDEQTKSAYLLPVDGYGSNVNTAYKLDDIYKTLGQERCNSVTVFLDACFSGAKRDGAMLASARGVAIKVKNGAPQGNMVVFSASTGDETAGAYNEQGHGRFTYFLLKKLQSTQGNVNLNDLSSYIISNVKRVSVDDGKSQTPTVVPSATVGEAWKTWTLR